MGCRKCRRPLRKPSVISLRVQVRTFARLSLADIANPAAGVINYGFAELTGSSGLNKTHFVQGAPGRMVVGSLDSTSQLRIFTWLDSSNSITANTVGITHSRRARPTRRSLPTASTGWQSHSPATSPARRTSSFQPNPAVAFVWHPDYAYAMAALGSSGEEMGMTLAVGGGTLGYPQQAVGFRNDFVVFQEPTAGSGKGPEVSSCWPP